MLFAFIGSPPLADTGYCLFLPFLLPSWSATQWESRVHPAAARLTLERWGCCSLPFPRLPRSFLLDPQTLADPNPTWIPSMAQLHF